MDFSNLQSRVNTPYIPPHRTQLHPRMHHPNPKLPNNRNKFLILLVSLFTIPTLYYLFSTARKLHQSAKFAEPDVQYYGIVIDSGLASARLRVFKFLGYGQMPFIDSTKARGDLDRSIQALIDFAKKRVPKKEWANTRVQLMVNNAVEDRVLEQCRRVLRASGFAFKDAWASVLEGQEKGMYAWIATNYVLGTLGGEPQKTIGIVELGGTSLQVTFAMRESSQVKSTQMFKFAGVTYDLYTQSLPQFGQEAAWKLLSELQNSTKLKSVSSSRVGSNNPCIPRGYELTLSSSDGKIIKSDAAGNFSACRFEALTLLKRRRDKCSHPPCHILASFFSSLQDQTFSPENFFYSSELFGLVPRTSLFEMEAFGKHYCEIDWGELKKQHHGIDDLDLLRYCFFSAFAVALLHDSLGIPLHDKRIGFINHTEKNPIDWTLGAFIFESKLKSLEQEREKLDQFVGNESVTYLSLFAFLLIVLLTAIFVVQWRKPQLKTIYDLEKGHYIVTRVPR
ncbi:probable apyrase 6 isoform X2 [Mangifera indica]|uniref:probable apyrase 6 isoform X2 n=1 Tax=Mangifera indica TaxID=29780 RepID=UPI001CFA7E5F|nr:probable apyrase 6 isoform X2 [Mangifera indica]